MYNVSVTNNYIYYLFLDGGGTYVAGPGGGTGNLTNWGSHSITVPKMGDINFIDLADAKISAYTNPNIPWTNATWGGLIRYQGLEAYFRYEGQGQVNVVVDPYGGVSLNFPQGGMLINLPDLQVI